MTARKKAKAKASVATCDAKTIEAQDGKGESVCHAVMSDITERKQAEEKLKSSEIRYRRLFESAQDGILILDAVTGMVVDVNPFLIEMLGYSREEYLEKKVWELGFLKNIITNQDNFLELRQKEYIYYDDLPLETFDGRRIDVEFISNVYLVDNKKVIQCNIRDIFDRKQAKEALLAASLYSRTLLETCLDSLVTISTEGRITDVNKATEKITGVSRERLIGSDFADYFTEPEMARAGYLKVFEQGQVIDYPLAIRHTSGAITNVLYTASVYRNEQGEILGVFAAARDITKLKRAEQELKSSNEEMKRFTYTVSHDLKSPLVTIKTFLGYLVQDMLKQDAVRIDKDIGYISGAADMMSRLLDELLKFSRVGRTMNPSVEAPLQTIVKDALDLVAGQIAERGVRVEVTEEPVLLYGDRPQLVDIFQNLVDNAVKFMGDQAAPLVEIGVEPKGDACVFFVRDNGIGIDPRHQGKLFGLFEKLNPGTEGTGIGLALVRQIVEVHGGKIWLESAGPGKGTIFRFTLAKTKRGSR